MQQLPIIVRSNVIAPFVRPPSRRAEVAGGNDAFTKILLHFDGSDGSTTITDSNAGGSSHTWTANGNAQIDTAVAKFGGAALLLDGTGDYVSTPSHADFNALGTNAFVIDAQINTSTSGTRMGICGITSSGATNASSSFWLERNASNQISMSVFNGTTQYSSVSSATVSSAGWHHVAGIVDPVTGKVYVALDGTVSAGTAYPGSVNSTTDILSVGRLGAFDGFYFNGSEDEVRLTVGTTRGWISNFSPPASAYS